MMTSPSDITNGSVHTTHNQTDKEKYPCYNDLACTSSWTYDDWHCTGCHWKGMGLADLEFGSEELRQHAAKLKAKLIKEVLGNRS